MNGRADNRGGFSLIEVALALLVISVGLVAAVGMLPGSIDNSKRASDDTQQALFADYVLNSLRAMAANTNIFVERWSDINGSGPKIPIAAPDMWDGGRSAVVTPGAGYQKLTMKPADNPNIEEIVLYYDLKITDGAQPGLKRAELKTYTGSLLNTNSLRVFCADIFRGALP